MNLPVIIAAIVHRQNRRNAQDAQALTEHVHDIIGSTGRRVRFATVVAQGTPSTRVTLAGVGEGNTADGANYPVCVAYTTATINGTNGPAAGHTAVLLKISDGNEVIIGHIV